MDVSHSRLFPHLITEERRQKIEEDRLRLEEERRNLAEQNALFSEIRKAKLVESGGEDFCL